MLSVINTRALAGIRNACKTPFNFIDVRIALNSDGKGCEKGEGILWRKVCNNVIKISAQGNEVKAELALAHGQFQI